VSDTAGSPMPVVQLQCWPTSDKRPRPECAAPKQQYVPPDYQSPWYDKALASWESFFPSIKFFVKPEKHTCNSGLMCASNPQVPIHLGREESSITGNARWKHAHGCIWGLRVAASKASYAGPRPSRPAQTTSDSRLRHQTWSTWPWHGLAGRHVSATLYRIVARVTRNHRCS